MALPTGNGSALCVHLVQSRHAGVSHSPDLIEDVAESNRDSAPSSWFEAVVQRFLTEKSHRTRWVCECLLEWQSPGLES